MLVIKNQKNQKPLTLSIIIPVYNEENYLGRCLDSIAQQITMPDEVIVVDNNSTDKSLEIAKSYNFVKILHEPRQHQSFAQKTGFDYASGDILARIDADTILPADWTDKVAQEFAKNPEVVALSGGGAPYDMLARKLTEFFISRFYEIAALCSGHRMLWGSNCAIRNSAWQKISRQVLLRKDIWEDYDLAFCAARFGRIKSVKNIQVAVSLRSGQKPLLAQIDYQTRAFRTYYLRAGLARTLLFMIFWLPMAAVYLMVVLDRSIRFSLAISKSAWTTMVGSEDLGSSISATSRSKVDKSILP